MRFNKPMMGAAPLLALLLAGSLSAQDSRGALRGRVTDPSGGVLAGAEVRATSMASGVTASARSNESGNYNIPFLLPDTYTVSVEQTGFKRFVRPSVQIRVSETVELNISMELGAVAETVEVTDETPLLDTASSSLGQVIDARRVLELPVAAGNPLELMLLTPGLVEPSKFLWKAAWNGRDVIADGGTSGSFEHQIDGVSNTFASGGSARYAFAPPASAIREFKMQTAAYDASVGHTPSALVNVSTASGTNGLHGELHWASRNSAFDAPNFFNNKNGTKYPVYQDNRYGASAGGPVYLPKLYNGKNRTFWHYTWEANKWGVPQQFTGTVPTEAQRQGDFSRLLALGSAYQIYDPATIALAAGGRTTRQPLPNNIIPGSRLDTVGVNLAKWYPFPNQPGTTDGRNNFFNGSNIAAQNYWVHLVRVDHAFSENHRAFIRFHSDFWEEDKDHRFFRDNISNGIVLNRYNKGLALDDVVVLNPSLVLNLRYGLTHQDFTERRSSRGFDLASMGFSPGLVGLTERDFATIPRVSAGAYSEISRWESGDGNNASLTHSAAATVTWLRNSHNLKFGADVRVYRSFGNRFPTSTSPWFQFSNTYTRGPFDNSAGAPLGQELAAMLLGIPAGFMERTASYAMQDKWLGLFFHDDYKLSRTLTLNLGLRWEIESPVSERFDRLVAGFDATTPNPIEAAARANYARAPIPELPVANFRALGGLQWVNQDARSPFQGEKNNFMPRIGLAWQVTPKTTIRAGYGMYFDSIGVNTTRAIQTGFSQSTPIQASLDEGVTFIATNANPFPRGLLSPLGASGGLTTNLGQSIEFYSSKRYHPYSQRWSLGVQRLLPGQFVADVSYVGNRGTRLPVSRSINDTPAQYLSTTPYRDQTAINFLSAQFDNPFYGVDPIYGARTSRAALLRPFPHFGNITYVDSAGYSWYHSLQSQVEKRFSQGYTLQFSYTFSKLMEAVSFLNPTDPMPHRVIGSFDRPHRVTMSGIWEVPVGRGRRFGSRLPAAADFAFGGWQLGSIVVRQAGAPLGFGNAIFNGDLKNIPLPKDERTVDRWFNTAAGFNRNSQEQLASNLRAFPLRFAGIRADGRATWDFSAIKNFAVRETLTMQLRAECFNAWNHANFNAPDTNPTSSSFGRITSAAEGRNWQFSLKLKF
jgi:hypothetical protein